LPPPPVIIYGPRRLPVMIECRRTFPVGRQPSASTHVCTDQSPPNPPSPAACHHRGGRVGAGPRSPPGPHLHGDRFPLHSDGRLRRCWGHEPKHAHAAKRIFLSLFFMCCVSPSNLPSESRLSLKWPLGKTKQISAPWEFIRRVQSWRTPNHTPPGLPW